MEGNGDVIDGNECKYNVEMEIVIEEKKRVRYPVNRLIREDIVSPMSAPRQKKKPKTENVMTEESIAEELNFKLGDEVYLKGRLEYGGFKGEILSINAIDKGIYSLGMANPCHGLWGDSIKRPASKMKELAHRLYFSEFENSIELPPLIPIEFTIECPVFDHRHVPEYSVCTSDQDNLIKKALVGWVHADTWSTDVWTVEADLLEEMWKTHQINYSIFFLLVKDVIENNFIPNTDDSFDAHLILPPRGGSVKLLQDYIQACERRELKFVMSFDYVWIFMDKKCDK